MEHKNNRYVTFKLSEDLYSRLDALAKSTGRSKMFYFEECFEKHFPKYEAIYMHQKKQNKSVERK